jgi:hypothetical protein
LQPIKIARKLILIVTLKEKMDNKGLLFIPDISGFTRFVSETEIGHSRLIIQELLETLINCNEIGLEISEIEGDAILFYRFGESPQMHDLYKQVEKMFCEFHRHIIAYDHRRFCQCKACTSAIGLTLKVITHYGEFTDYNVKNFRKLIGKDIIVAHQLLKNDIEQHEYWLVTTDLLQNKSLPDFTHWMKWSSSAKQTDNGEIPFHYTQLSQLKDGIILDPIPQWEIPEKVKVLSLSKEYDTDIITLFHATGDFTYRSRWQEGVKKIEEANHFLPRIGTRCRCIMENGEVSIYASSYSYSPERIMFSETDESKEQAKYFLLEKKGYDKTSLTLDLYLKKNVISQILFKLWKKKEIEKSFRKSLLNLDKVVKEIKLPTP